MFSIVLTTINNPKLLIDYHKALKDVSHNIIVVPDNKTPEEARETVKKVGGEWLDRNLLGYENDDAKRMEGIIRAIERKDDFVVLLDDDNYFNDNLWYLSMSKVGDIDKFYAWYSRNNWVNCCEALNRRDIFPRGFPYSKMREAEIISEREENDQIIVNAGLWTESPDVDAVFHLIKDVRTTELSDEFILGENQYCPFNSQNTAILTDTLCGYFFRPKMEGETTRYSDIFAGLFYEKIANHLGGRIFFGRPLSKHIRNSHDYLRDALQEIKEAMILEDILPSFEEAELKQKDWGDCLAELLDQLNGKNKETKTFLEHYKKEANKYLEICEKYA